MSPESKRDWRLYAEDIIEACEKVRRYIAGMTFDAFLADERTRDAVIRNIEIVGEAAKGIPDDVAAGAPEIPWRNVRGMRDVLAHGYFSASSEIIWATATTRLDAIEAAARRLLGAQTPDR
ncbi:MAG: DUF86 domain-containing protein [Anaeromyxobacter sp.]